MFLTQTGGAEDCLQLSGTGASLDYLNIFDMFIIPSLITLINYFKLEDSWKYEEMFPLSPLSPRTVCPPAVSVTFWSLPRVMFVPACVAPEC